MHTGYVDIAQRDKIAGWAADPDAPDEVIEVVVLVNGREAGRVKADRLRVDLRNLGKYGEGKHGFEFTFDPPLDPIAEHDVVVRFAASRAALTRGALRLGRQAKPVSEHPRPAVHFLDRERQPTRAARGRPRYVLHVGLPKTGTKYLQHNFWRFRERLRAHGVYYPSEWWKERPIFSHQQLAEDLRNVPNPRIADIFASLNVCGSEIVLLSSEGFNPVAERGLRYLRDLTQDAKVEIVFYARRWSDWIPSQWQQAVKQGGLQTFPEWYAVLLANADTHPGINQAIYLDKFAHIFGRENIRLVSYSNLQDYKVDIFHHFYRNILELPELPSITADAATVHESMGILLTELIRSINVQEAMRSTEPGYHVFAAYQGISADRAVRADTDLLYAAMARHVAEMTLDDNLYFLEPIYARLNEYKNRMVSAEYGGDVFERRRRTCRYVRPEYLMEDGVLDAVRRISQAVRRRLGAAEAAPSAAPLSAKG
jgi:hypothetical protein